MKKLFLILFVLCISLSVFCSIQIQTAKTDLEVGEKIELKIQSDSPKLNVEITGGGFTEPKILFDGITMKNNSASVFFIAPYIEKKYKVTFKTQKESKSVEFNVINKKLQGEDLILKIDDLKGAIVIKNANSNISSPLNKNTVIKENQTIIVPQNGALKLKGPNEIIIDVSSNTEIAFEILKKSGDKLDIRYKVKSGMTYNVINQKLVQGSKFLVNDSKSVVAGVRGTRFAFDLKKDKKTTIKVFDGTIEGSRNDKSFEVDDDELYTYDEETDSEVEEDFTESEEDYLDDYFDESFIDDEMEIIEEDNDDEDNNEEENNDEDANDSEDNESSAEENNNSDNEGD